MTTATESTVAKSSNLEISSSSVLAAVTLQGPTQSETTNRVATVNYAQVAGRVPPASINSKSSTYTAELSLQANQTSSVNSKKLAVTTAAVPPALPIVSPSISQAATGPTHFSNAPSNFNGQGHVRRKSTVNQPSAVPGPRRTWSLNNAVHFSAQQNQPSIATNGSAPIQFGSINAGGESLGISGTTNSHSANLSPMNSSLSAQPPSNSASPVPPHAVISGGIPRFQAVPNGSVKFGTVETTDKRDVSTFFFRCFLNLITTICHKRGGLAHTRIRWHTISLLIIINTLFIPI
ncbi:hypothetical protein V1517DRAFT_313395 [Lipomyces orientalis]|uniref:Uncharacterized protein n=1 Tax=Lipomyces orientalis TaxID=1233043 RepID=A0ACC3TWW9_9ASCO